MRIIFVVVLELCAEIGSLLMDVLNFYHAQIVLLNKELLGGILVAKCPFIQQIHWEIILLELYMLVLLQMFGSLFFSIR